jgi:hypothetical protein
MTTPNPSPQRPLAGGGSSLGDERYDLLRASFLHVQLALRDRYYIEAITVLESILADRLGSLLQGSRGLDVTLRQTLGGLLHAARRQKPAEPENADSTGDDSAGTPIPVDIASFLNLELSAWWDSRNNAVHGMAKLHAVGDDKFDQRYGALETVALEGVRVLLRLDEFDQREKRNNGAGISATFPDAFELIPDLADRIFPTTGPTS